MPPIRMLLVSEDDQRRRIASGVLAHAGFDVHAVASVSEAMAWLESRKADSKDLVVFAPEDSPGIRSLAQWMKDDEVLASVPVMVDSLEARMKRRLG